MKRLFIISIIVLLIDLISKRLVLNLLIENQSFEIIENFFSLTYVKNTGVAFSMIEGYVPLIVIVTVIILFMLFKYIKDGINNSVELVSYGFIIGGAVGNLVDRIIMGYVVDFFDFNIFGYQAPIFNVADIFIVVGVLMLIIFGRNGDKYEVNSK